MKLYNNYALWNFFNSIICTPGKMRSHSNPIFNTSLFESLTMNIKSNK